MRPFNRGQTICKIGDPVDYVYLIKHGEFDVATRVKTKSEAERKREYSLNLFKNRGCAANIK